MGGLFSRSTKDATGKGGGGVKNSNANNNQSKLTEKDKAVLDLKNARDKLKKFQKKLEAESQGLEDKARELIKKKYKDRALLVLKLQKYKRDKINSIESQLYSVQEQIDTLDWAVINVQVVQAMRKGTDELMRINNLISMDKIETLMDETKDAMDVQNEISAAIVDLVGGSTAEEEAMLEELMKWDSSNKSTTSTATKNTDVPVFPNAPVNLEFPSVPTTTSTNTNAEIAANSNSSSSSEERVAVSS
jgi:charged multivesicular body protein 6